MTLKNWASELLAKSRVAHMATSTKNGKPHVVPICYACDGNTLYTSIDEKPKRLDPSRLRRIQNLAENPQVSLVVDEYSEDWVKLKFVMIRGSARILREGAEHRRAISLLRAKYHQYASMKLEERPVIRIDPYSITDWNASGL